MADKERLKFTGYEQEPLYYQVICGETSQINSGTVEHREVSPIDLIRRIKHLEEVNKRMYNLLERLEIDCEIFHVEFGEPSSGEYEAAFTEIDDVLKEARGGWND